MKKIVESALKDYKRKKSLVETSKERISAWNYALNNFDVVEDVFANSKPDDCWILGSNRSSYPTNNSFVESELIKRESNIELLQKFIREEESRMFLLNLEVSQIEKALGSLNTQEVFIVECKYFENMTWINTEKNFNEKFIDDGYITVAGLRKINSNSILKIVDILSPFYSMFKSA